MDDLDIFDEPKISRESIEALAAESGLTLKKCFRLLRNSFGDVNVAREWIEKDRVVYESSRVRSAQTRALLRQKQKNWEAIEGSIRNLMLGIMPEVASGEGLDNIARVYGGIVPRQPSMDSRPSRICRLGMANGSVINWASDGGVRPYGRLNNDDGSWTQDVWFEPAYQNEPRWVPCRRDRFGVWRVIGGRYMAPPVVDSFGRLNGSL